MLRIDLEPGDSVRIGNYAVITLEQKSGQRARLGFEADRSIPIERVKTSDSDARVAAANGITGSADKNP